MVSQDSLLVTLFKLVDHLPMPSLPTKRGRGHPQVYPDRLFLKALVIMIVRHLHTVHELLSVLAQPTAEMRQLHEELSEHLPRSPPPERFGHRPLGMVKQDEDLGLYALGAGEQDSFEQLAHQNPPDSSSARAQASLRQDRFEQFNGVP